MNLTLPEIKDPFGLNSLATLNNKLLTIKWQIISIINNRSFYYMLISFKLKEHFLPDDRVG